MQNKVLQIYVIQITEQSIIKLRDLRYRIKYRKYMLFTLKNKVLQIYIIHITEQSIVKLRDLQQNKES